MAKREKVGGVKVIRGVILGKLSGRMGSGLARGAMVAMG